ncbi:MAG: TRAP-type C4-dicarboxylate transport system, periplasmic component [Myxococcaceae bacterium]|nr:TRAP-type C4-dicarboxylate transport system, periplasmic component [Myxococcaceae bacterium]
MKRTLLKTLLIGAGMAGLLALPSLTSVSAAGTTTISMASLAPAGSSWDQVFRAWGNSLKQQTGGAVQFKFFPGGMMGEERVVIGKMKLGSLDAAGLTSIGLGQIARPVSILQMGVIKNYKQLNHVREQLGPDFEAMFQKEGYHLLGWGDAGFGRIFSKRPILKPEDYKTVRPWVPSEDASLPEFMKIVGANGVPLGIIEVGQALQTGMIDTVVVSAIAAVALQWASQVTHVSKEANTAIVGATLVREDLFKSLAPDHQKVLLETGKKAHAALVARVQAEDAKAYKTLISRGMIEFDPMGTPAQKEAWTKVSDELIKRLTGRLWSKELLEKVKKTAAATPE